MVLADQAAAVEPAASLRNTTLRITEIFLSLQGETSRVGLPTVFVRLTGCPLRCGYCDTAYAFHGGTTFTLDQVLADVARHATRYVTVTGGEPLAQKGCLPLLTALADRGYSVSLETSGALDIAASTAASRASWISRRPGSGEVDKNRWENLACLNARDEIKFVLCDERDYAWAKDALEERRLDRICPVLFSPSYGSSTRATSQNGCCATACRCACSSSFTRSCGAKSAGANGPIACR